MSPTNFEYPSDSAQILMGLSASNQHFNANFINLWTETCSNFSLPNASALLSLIRTINSTARLQSDFHNGSIKYAIKLQSLGRLHIFFSSFTNGPLRQVFNNLEEWPTDTLEEKCRSLIFNQRADEHNFSSNYKNLSQDFIRSLNTELLPADKVEDQLNENLMLAWNCLHLGSNPAIDVINLKKRLRCENLTITSSTNHKTFSSRFSTSFNKLFAYYSIPTDPSDPSEFADVHIAQFGKMRNNPTHRLPVAGIVDGYSGTHCARFMSVHLPDRITNFIIENSGRTDLPNSFVYHFLQRLFPEVNDSYLATIPKGKIPMQKSGCAASFAFILNHACWIANCGDCFAIRSRDTLPIMYSRPHYIDQQKDSSSYFGDDALLRGCEVAYVWEGNKWSPNLRASSFAPNPSTAIWSGLTTSHSLGRPPESGIAPTAEIFKIDLNELGKEDFLILASNGIMSVMSPAQASTIVSSYRALGHNLEETCKYLSNLARHLGSQDDVTVVILDLNEANRQRTFLQAE